MRDDLLLFARNFAAEADRQQEKLTQLRDKLDQLHHDMAVELNEFAAGRLMSLTTIHIRIRHLSAEAAEAAKEAPP